jgi:hypothetical protein
MRSRIWERSEIAFCIYKSSSYQISVLGISFWGIFTRDEVTDYRRIRQEIVITNLS